MPVRRRRLDPRVICLVTMGIVFAAIAIFNLARSEPIIEIEDIASNEESSVEIGDSAIQEALPEAINFQPTIDTWVKNVPGGNKSVIIYDLDRDEIVGTHNPEELHETASLYKLFVVYEGYRRLNTGEWRQEELVSPTNYTVLECLDLAIRESNSVCAELLRDKIGRNNLQMIIENDFGLAKTNLAALTSTPQDILKMMRIFYDHTEIDNDELVNRMKDSFLNQPKVGFDDWRQGLPSGFQQGSVYNKVGWEYDREGGYWRIYHDAAIVEFPSQNRHFVIIVMTERVDSRQLKSLGEMLEEAFLSLSAN